MDPHRITELAKLLRNSGDKILSSEFKFTLTGSLLRALNDSFSLIDDSVDIGGTVETFCVVKPNNFKSNVFRDLQLVHDFVQKTTLLCIVHYFSEQYFEGLIDISKFRALKRLEVQKTNVRQITGIQPLRARLQQLICIKSLQTVDDIITHCGGDQTNGFVWNELKFADFSYNNLKTVDTSLEFAQYLQHLNLRHNKLTSVLAIKWLPHLKTLDLSYNCLQCIPQFHIEACKRLQSLNMSNNYIEDLRDVAKLDALTDLNLSDNCLLDHIYLMPLSTLVTLKFLSLYGNPLHCHPKHRLATAQYLHKNTATVKFILDSEPLTKTEKALIGTQQICSVGQLKQYVMRASATSITTSTATNTPASSVGSLRSLQWRDSTTSTDAEISSIVNGEISNKKRNKKMRTVDIEDHEHNKIDVETLANDDAGAKQNETKDDLMQKSLQLEQDNSEHLKTKKQIEMLREKYGAEWLQNRNVEIMMQSGMKNAEECGKSRQLFNDYLGELSANESNTEESLNISTSTSTSDILLHNQFDNTMTSTKNAVINQDTTIYNSVDSNGYKSDETLYASTRNISVYVTAEVSKEQNNQHVIEVDDEHAHLRDVYASSAASVEEENAISDVELDEDCYIVYNVNNNDEAVFLTISRNFVREKDSITQRTKTKWSIKILESCERIKSNMLRINFDTIKRDKQERIYTVEDGLCEELQKKLRQILSQRDLTEMNIIIYRCVNCNSQFTREQKQKHYNSELRCPDCRSTFVAELQDIPKSMDKPTLMQHKDKLSPAAIVEESLVRTISWKFGQISEQADDTNSIGSANSLNESSSCSKITNTNSQYSFDSNQSIMGSSNTERDLEFRTNCESDVDIISNPSQSSVEVLDQTSRNASEERCVTHIEPTLEHINNPINMDGFMEREFEHLKHNKNNANGTVVASTVSMEGKDNTFIMLDEAKIPTAITTPTIAVAAIVNSTTTNAALTNVQLTESSSSGSVTDSICTTYEQTDKDRKINTLVDNNNAMKQVVNKIVLPDSLVKSESAPVTKNINNEGKKEDVSLSAMFGALFQSTNILMSSSKKLEVSNCQPYKFNYNDFNDIDHRLKLYFYQTKFEDPGEHFKWLARGRIYNEQTHTLCEGIIVMSTCKCYLMEIYAPECDNVGNWLRQVISVTMDRLASIQLLPWKVGLAFTLRDWGGFLLLLQDILRTDSLLLYFTNAMLPAQCTLKYQPAVQIIQRLNTAVMNEQIKMFSLLSDCEITCDSAKRLFNTCALLTTDSRLYLSSSNKLNWLTILNEQEHDIELCVTQFMSNLVDVERQADNKYIINFLDETQNKCELWQLHFETKENAESCINAIGQSWEQLFGVPLLNA